MSVVRSGVAGLALSEDQIAKSDRLFRAAISGFCSLTMATRLDATRLDQLALPLLPLVTDESRRYAAAALSRSFPGPQGLVRRLAEEDISISAPILVGSPVLSDIDLIGLIGRHGLSHAGAVASRANLNANIAALIRALGVPGPVENEAAAPSPAEEAPARPEPALAAPLDVEPAPANDAAPARPSTTAPAQAASEVQPVADAFDEYVRAEPGAAEEAARAKLRAMMMPAGPRAPSRAHPAQEAALAPLDWDAAHAAANRVVATGLSGKAALFHTAIADAFELDFRTAASIADDTDLRRLAMALKAATLPPAQAFLIAALAFPPRFVTTAAIRSFIELYAAIDVERARREVEALRRRMPRPPAASSVAPVANTPGRRDDSDRPAASALRAS